MSSLSYSQETLEHAIELVKTGSMSLNGASKAFNIPFSTLGDKVRGRRPIKANSKFLLTEEEEKQLVKWIGSYAERSMGRTNDDVKNKVKEILEQRGMTGRRNDGRPGKDWLIGFKRRHPEIKLRKHQALGKQRVSMTGYNFLSVHSSSVTSSNSYSQETLEHAIGLVKSGSMSLNGASKAFNIPFSTLGDKVRGRRPIKAKSKFLLTEEEEGKLVKWISFYAERSMEKSNDDVRNKVKEILEQRGMAGRGMNGRPGKDWLVGFKRRHPEIKLQRHQTLGKLCASVSGYNSTSDHSSSIVSSNSYSQETLEHAIELIKSSSMSLSEASKTFNIPFSTLGDKVRGRRPIKAKTKFLLTEEEEEKLVKWIGSYAERSMGRSNDDVKNKVKEILEQRGTTGRGADGCPGKDWLIGFKCRHPEITLLMPQALGKEHALVSGYNMNAWFQKTKKYLDSNDPDLLKSADRTFNAGEIGFSLCPAAKKVLAPTGIKNLYSSSNNNRKQLTVLCCASAAGEFVPPLVIFPRKRFLSQHLLDGFKEASMQISPNGSVNSIIFHTWLTDVFIPFVEKKKKPIVLFVDGHTSHNSDISSLELCNEHGIILYGLLPNDSHIMQPLDLTVFGSIRSTWPEVLKQQFVKTGETALVTNFSHLLKSVWDEYARPESSMRGFMRSGIFPFKPSNPLSSSKLKSEKSFTTLPPSNCALPQPSTQSMMTNTPTISNAASAVSTATHLLPSTSTYSVVPDLSLIPSPLTSTLVRKAVDNVEVLLRLSHKIGIEKSVEFLNAIRKNTTALQNDTDFILFQEAIAALGTGSQCTMTSTHVPQNLDNVLASRQKQRSKSGKALKKNSSLRVVISSNKYKAFLKRKDDNNREAQEEVDKRKLVREQIKENRRREKRERLKEMRQEHKNEKQKEKHEKMKREKQKLIEKRKIVESRKERKKGERKHSMSEDRSCKLFKSNGENFEM